MKYLIRGTEYLAEYPNFRLVGRDQELQRLVSILMRNHANSVILMGPGGVGCTALCLGIQAAKRDPDTPFDILNKRLFWLDSDGLFSTGNIEEINRLFHRIIDRLNKLSGSILVVEDTRDLIEACRNNGTMHFINALLVEVRKRKTQIIFETKDEDLDAVLKCHSDMHELFTTMPLDAPTGENLHAIVAAAAENLSKHHGVKVLGEAVDAAIEFTNRYQTRDNGLNRAQPERSITLIDRALAAYRLDVHRKPPGFDQAEWQARQTEMRNLYQEQRDGENAISAFTDQIDALNDREAELTKPDPANARTQIFQAGGFDTPEMAALHTKIRLITTEVDKVKNKIIEITAEINANLALDRTIVSAEFADISGIALDKLNQDEIAKLRGLDAVLRRRIFGQDDAVRRVTDGVRVARIGRRSAGRPLPFLFLGPSGTGKTELSKSIAEGMLDDETALVRFDMSEYMEKHAVAKLIGAPPGYEGFEAGGILTNLMRRNSNRVLLFDEIEKGHSDVFDIFLQILSDGRLTDNVGRVASFDGTIIVMTTNIGQPHFLDASMSEPEAEAVAIDELGQHFKSEFLNRFNGRQNIICFKKLDLPTMEKIVLREIVGMDMAYREKGIRVEANGSVISDFCRDQYDATIGARGLPGFITANLEPIIVNAIMADQDVRGTAHVTYNTDSKRFDVQIS